MIRGMRRILAAGLKDLVFPAGNRYGATQPGYLAALFGLGLLPPSRYDYRKEAGAAWDNGVIRRGIKWFGDCWLEAPHVVTRVDRDGKPQPVPDHPLLQLLERPNRHYDAACLWAGTLLSWIVDGNAYWYLEKNALGQVIGLVYVPHFEIQPYGDPTGRELVAGYLYRVNGEDYPFAPEDILHFRSGIDPANQRKGLSDVGAELRAVCTDNEAQSYAAGLLRNMGVPGVIISPKGDNATITQAQAEQLKVRWREQFTGDGRGEPLATPLPIEIQSPGFSPEQLALDKIASMPIPRLCAAMGLDPLMLGLPSDSKTYANVEQAREAAYETRLIPMQRNLDLAITHKLLPLIRGGREGDRLGRDYSRVRCLQEDLDKQYARQTAAVGGPWLLPNEARGMLGLPELEGGNVLYPAGAAGLGPAGAVGEPSDGGKAFRVKLSAKWRERRLEAERQA